MDKSLKIVMLQLWFLTFDRFQFSFLQIIRYVWLLSADDTAADGQIVSG